METQHPVTRPKVKHELSDLARVRLSELRDFISKSVYDHQFKMHKVIAYTRSDEGPFIESRRDGLFGLFGERYEVLRSDVCGCVAGITLCYFAGSGFTSVDSDDQMLMAERILGISPELAEELFRPYRPPTFAGLINDRLYWRSLTRRDAVSTLDELLDTGYVAWDYRHLIVGAAPEPVIDAPVHEPEVARA